jgi:hypothetical protein
MPGFDSGVVFARNVDFSGEFVNKGTAKMVADGQLLIAATDAPNIRVSTLTAGTGINITNGPGQITISHLLWSDSAGGDLDNFRGYFATAAATYTLPEGEADGDSVEIVSQVGAGVVLTADGTDRIRIGSTLSSAGGTATSTAVGDALRLIFRLADTTWYQAPGSQGTWNVT